MSPLRNRAAAAALVAAAALAGRPSAGWAETFQPATGTVTWNATSSWSPASIPNGVGASAVFNGAATANNLAQTANRTASLDAAITVGSITFNTDLSTFTNSVTTGSGGPLTFDATGTGPATINVPAAPNGTGSSTISVAMTLTDSVVATVDNTTASSAAGALNLTGTMSGPGGFTKNGDGLATFGTGARTYTGATVLNGGRTRISTAAMPANTSSFTVNAGGQLDTIAAGTYTFGTGSLNLNGVGATTGTFAQFPAAIRPDRGLAIVFTNATVLQSDTLLHMQANAGTAQNPVGSITFSGPISGPGRLTFTAPNSDADMGTLSLTADNSYTGGTLVAGGILAVSGAAADLGTGNVTVSDATSPTSIARLSIASGVANAIANTATLTITGGGTAGTADENFVILGAGVNEQVAGLVLGGVTQTVPGTYGATGSGATFVNDEYFSGAGVVTLAPIPEPAGVCLVAFAGAGLLARRRRRRAERAAED